MDTRECVFCGNAFKSKNTNTTCSPTCRSEQSKKYRREWARKKTGVQNYITCENCGIEFYMKGRSKCCSDECTHEYKTRLKKEYYEKNSDRLIKYQKERYSKGGKPKKCIMCESLFTHDNGRVKLCSDKCREESRRCSRERYGTKKLKGKYERRKTCKICGETFLGKSHNASICSEDCANKNNSILCRSFTDRRPDVQARNYLKKYKEYDFDDEMVEILSLRISLRRALKKAGE